MADVDDKENLSPVRNIASNMSALQSSSPPKATKKTRSKSIGPGGLEELEAAKQQKSPAKSRRRSAMTQIIQLPKSILPSRDEEQKRKEARRKSLANRRVSFAPEATLHTWDVIEYMRDATASSSASDNARRASSHASPSFASTPDRQPWEPDSDPPSTPPEQADDDDDLPHSPEHQRNVHQKKRRRSSAIPPMNFNNPDDDFSSSPASGSSIVQGSSDVEEEEDDDDDEGESMDDDDDDEEDDEDDDAESTAMSLDAADNTVQSMRSDDTASTDASLTARLRQAAQMAGTRGIDYDEHGDMSMEMATQEVTNAFQPWAAHQTYDPPPLAKNMIALQDQENVNPFSPAFRQAYPDHKPQGVPSTIGEESEISSGEMSMDMTRAVGGILREQQSSYDDDDDNEEAEDNDMSMDITKAIGGILQTQSSPVREDVDDDNDNDISMDMTRAVGGILQSQTTDAQPPRSALKRRLSTTDDGSPFASAQSPVKPSQRRTVAQVNAKRRRSSAGRSSIGDATMDFTMAVGGIQHQPSPAKEDRRTSLRRRRSSGTSSMGEQTMDFTAVVGSIRQTSPLKPQQRIEEEQEPDDNEELSMEFTAVIGGINIQTPPAEPPRPVTPRECSSPARTEVPTTPKHDGHFREAKDQSAKKLLTPMFEQHLPGSAVKDSAGSRPSSTRNSASKTLDSPRKSPARSPTRPEQSPALPKKSPVAARKSPASGRKTRQTIEPTTNVPSAMQVDTVPAASPQASQPSISPASARNESLAPIMEDVVYPTLPAPEPQTTPVISSPVRATTPQSHHPHTVSEAGSPLPASAGTPEPIDMEMLNPSSPSMEKQLRSSPLKKPATPQQHLPPALTATPQPNSGSSAFRASHHQRLASSPLRHIITPQQPAKSPLTLGITPQQPGSSQSKRLLTSQQPHASTPQQSATPQQQPTSGMASITPRQPVVIDEPSRTISDSIKMMSTPRKETGTTPLKRLRGMTPMKSPAKKSITPRKIFTPKTKTPQTINKPSAAELVGQQLAQELFAATKTGQQMPKVHLNEFLDMAGVKFMDLAMPTKRRYTVAPTPGKSSRSDNEDMEDVQGPADLESAVVAGACTVPMLDLFQHSCRELKRYISEGKSFVKTLEQEVHADPPPFISAYVEANAAKRAQLDNHMRDVKTNARLRSKEIWYDWRSKLLDGLEEGLKGIKNGLDEDAKILGDREQMIESVLPDLMQRHDHLRDEAERLEEAAASVSEEEKQELEASRRRLVDVNEQIAEKRRMLAGLHHDLREKENLVESYEEGKIECLAQIQEAERVKESCKGWSVDEVAALKASVTDLEKQTGWSINSASGSTLTMTYRNALSLFFDTAAFITDPSSLPVKFENQPISLTYVGGSSNNNNSKEENGSTASKSLTTESRFFLQLLRAHLHGLVQRTTPVKSLLYFVSQGWDTAERVAEAVRRLTLEHVVDVAILGDERLGVVVDVLLPKVCSKVRLNFEVLASIVPFVSADAKTEEDGKEQIPESHWQVETAISVKGKVVYGEPYNERNMEGFLGRRCGAFGQGWDDAVRDLRIKLVATGRKGVN